MQFLSRELGAVNDVAGDDRIRRTSKTHEQKEKKFGRTAAPLRPALPNRRDRAHGEGGVLFELPKQCCTTSSPIGLLAGDEPDHTELTRKVSQRAAILDGKDNAQRPEIERLVRGAYSTRSQYAHGTTFLGGREVCPVRSICPCRARQ